MNIQEPIKPSEQQQRCRALLSPGRSLSNTLTDVVKYIQKGTALRHSSLQLLWRV